MARLGCVCGHAMGTSEEPNPYALEIYYANEIREALKDDPNVTLWDLLTEWDTMHDCAKKNTESGPNRLNIGSVYDVKECMKFKMSAVADLCGGL